MSKFATFVAIGGVVFLAACAKEEPMEEEIIMVEPAAVTVEPTYNKY